MLRQIARNRNIFLEEYRRSSKSLRDRIRDNDRKIKEDFDSFVLESTSVLLGVPVDAVPDMITQAYPSAKPFRGATPHFTTQTQPQEPNPHVGFQPPLQAATSHMSQPEPQAMAPIFDFRPQLQAATSQMLFQLPPQEMTPIFTFQPELEVPIPQFHPQPQQHYGGEHWRYQVQPQLNQEGGTGANFNPPEGLDFEIFSDSSFLFPDVDTTLSGEIQTASDLHERDGA